MAYNRQTLEGRKVSIGMGKIYAAEWETPTADGVTPSDELAFANSVTFNLTASQVELYNGTPALLEEVFVGKEEGSITINVDEHDYRAWCRQYATGLCDSSDESFSGGGLIQTNKSMIKFRSEYNDGSYRDWFFWRCVGDGVLSVPYEKGDGTTHNTVDMTFKLMHQTGETTWASGVALADGELLFKTEYTAA